MTTAELALRVLMPGFFGTTLPDDYADLLREGLGSICFFGSNTEGGPEATAALTASILAVRPETVIAVDEEGGDVTRLHATEGSPVLGAAALGAVDDLDLTMATGAVIGTDLRAVGISLDLATVADVNSNADNPVIGTRSFSSSAAQAAEHVAAWVGGLQSAGADACVKHFPGHGDTAEDSHLALPILTAPLEVIRERELVPFIAAIEAGTASIMTSHIVVPALDPELPATLSPRILTGLLREELGFKGVIVSDALDMAGASATRGIPEAAVLSLVAGADLLCIGPNVEPATVRATQDAIVAAVEGGRLPLARLEEAAERVLTLAPRSDGTPFEVDDEAQLQGARKSLVVEGELPDLRGALIVSIDTVANIAVGAVPWGLTPDVVVQPTDALPTGAPLVIQVRDAHRRPEVLDLLGSVEGPAVIIEWGWPGPYLGPLPRICTRGYSRPGAAAVTELLRKAGWEK